MKGKQGRMLRRIGAIERLEPQITQYEKNIIPEKDDLKVARKEKDLMNVESIENKLNQYEKKLERATITLEHTKHNLR